MNLNCGECVYWPTQHVKPLAHCNLNEKRFNSGRLLSKSGSNPAIQGINGGVRNYCICTKGQFFTRLNPVRGGLSRLSAGFVTLQRQRLPQISSKPDQDLPGSIIPIAVSLAISLRRQIRRVP